MLDKKDNWILTQNIFIPNQALAWEGLFTQGTGYLHIRGSFEETVEYDPQNIEYSRDFIDTSVEVFFQQNTKWGTYIPGIYSPHPVYEREITNLPFSLGIDLFVEGEKFDNFSSSITRFKRSLNLKNAFLTREIIWGTENGANISLHYNRFIDINNKKLVLQQISIVSDKPVELEVKAGIDADVRTNGFYHFKSVECKADSKVCYCAVQTEGLNDVEVLTSMTGTGWKGESDYRSCFQSKKFKLEIGKELLIEKRSAYSSNFDQKKVSAKEVINHTSGLSFNELLFKHSKEWEKQWENCDIEISGDNVSQLHTRVSLYHLLRAHVEDDRVAIDAKGYAGDAYCGKFFWDTDIFMLPFFLYTDLQKAKSLTDFRIKCLDAAKDNAREYGYSGARFPWVTDVTGKEGGSLWQYKDNEVHVTGDVVYGLVHYMSNSEDDKYLPEFAAETIIETCRYWMDRIDIRKGKPVILGVMGPDEYSPFSHNNAYTNHLVKFNLRIGAHIGKILKISANEIEDWERMAKNLSIPLRSDGLILQSEDFEMLAEPEFDKYWKDRSKPFGAVVHQDRKYRSKNLKQPDALMMMWLFAKDFNLNEIKTAWDYYEPLCTHDSSLSPGIHGLIALRLGLQKKAWEYWKNTVGLDLDIDKGKASQGIHMANSGLVWQMIVFGFAGIKPAIETELLTIEPKLPENWKEISFPIIWKGKRINITIDHQKVKIENYSKSNLQIKIFDNKILVDSNEVINYQYSSQNINNKVRKNC